MLAYVPPCVVYTKDMKLHVDTFLKIWTYSNFSSILSYGIKVSAKFLAF